MQIKIEIMIDISMMLIKQKNLGLPVDEDDVFNKLQPYLKEKEKYKEMKRFRNLLVHRYGDVNDKLVYYNATNHIDDFYIFITDVKEILSK
ncbi:MAG: type VII toxin-antitoxin system HepT family RNase toxin [Promethearchaeota archaeon]